MPRTTMKLVHAIPALACVGCALASVLPSQVGDTADLLACVSRDWGKPVLVVAQDCSKGEVALVENAIADIEMLQQQHAAATSDAGYNEGGVPLAAIRVADDFPYKDNPRITALIAARTWH